MEKKDKEPIKNKAEYKRKQTSYQRGLDSLNSQIDDKNTELIKSLKKRPLPTELGDVMAVEETRSKKLEIANKLRNLVSEKAKEGAEVIKEDEIQGGDIHPVFSEK